MQQVPSEKGRGHPAYGPNSPESREQKVGRAYDPLPPRRWRFRLQLASHEFFACQRVPVKQASIKLTMHQPDFTYA